MDDGNKIKALNLQLKDAYKKGYFGKLTSGVGLDPFYYNQSLMAQYYGGVHKLSVYGISSNTGVVGLDWQDRMSYLGGGMNSVSMDGNSITISTDSEEGGWSGQYNGRGLPVSKAAGASYSTKLLENKLKVNVNYGYTDRKLDLETSNYRKQFLPASFITYDENSDRTSINKGHSGSLRLEYQLDSSTNIMYSTSLGLRKSLSLIHI